MAIVQSIFGDLAEGQNLQAVIDNSLTDLYAKTIWREYLDWGLPQVELTFESVIGRSRLEAAASIVDPDAPAPLRGRQSFELFKGKIPTMKEAFQLKQSDYRKIKQLENLPISDAAKKAELIKKLRDTSGKLAVSTDIRIDIMFLQSISTFNVDVSILNNPDGVVFGSIPLMADPTQKRTVVKDWSDAAADPFNDIDATVDEAGKVGRIFKEIWIDQERWTMMKKNAKVKADVKGYLNHVLDSTYAVTLSVVNAYLTENKLPTIKVVNFRKGIEKDGRISTINPFKKENAVFIPEGKLGTVQNAIAVEDWEPTEGINYAKYDRALISQWRDNNPWAEHSAIELNAFPSVEAIDGIVILQTDVETV